jgi:hypothetical protein
MANRPTALQSSRRIQRSSALVKPSRQRGYTARTTFSVRQVKWFLSQTQIWENSCNRPDDVVFHPDDILDKASRAYKVQPFERQSLWLGRSSLNMRIACTWSATLASWHGSIRERISSKFGKPIAQLSVRISSATVQTPLSKIASDEI